MLTLNEWVDSEYAAGRAVGLARAWAYVEACSFIDSIGQRWLLEASGDRGLLPVKPDPAAATKLRQVFAIEQVLLTWWRRFPPTQEAEAFNFALDVAKWLNRPKPASEEIRFQVLGEACGWLDSEAAQALLELITGNPPCHTGAMGEST